MTPRESLLKITTEVGLMHTSLLLPSYQNPNIILKSTISISAVPGNVTDKRYPVLIIYSMFSLLLHYCSLICDWHALRQPSQWEIILKRFSIAKSRNMGTESFTVLSSIPCPTSYPCKIIHYSSPHL